MTADKAHFGALFDWDGVLVATKALHERAWHEVAREFGYPHTTDDFAKHFGSQNDYAIREVLRWTREPGIVRRIAKRKEELFRAKLETADGLFLESSLAFREVLARHAVPCAVVSSAPRDNVRAVLDRFPGADVFQSLVTEEDVARGKPAPDAFLLGAQRLELPPGRCVVFEDAPVGIGVARAAGMRVVALSTTHPSRALAGADKVVEALSPSLFAELEAWF